MLTKHGTILTKPQFLDECEGHDANAVHSTIRPSLLTPQQHSEDVLEHRLKYLYTQLPTRYAAYEGPDKRRQGQPDHAPSHTISIFYVLEVLARACAAIARADFRPSRND